MKHFIVCICAVTLLVNCKQKDTSKETIPPPPPPVKEYPAAIASVFDAHGGITKWNAMNNLCFIMEKEAGNETHTIDLKSRKARIETDKFTLGFDGEKVWLDQDSTYFAPQRARFYHNLMFYFYAMPFVLGDEGIIYEKTSPLVFDGISYPGIKISYKDSIGMSPDDNYFIYYSENTYQMEWLGYTVTYFDKQASSDIHFTRYPEWEKVGGLLLPKSMIWYKQQEDGTLKETEGSVAFLNAQVSQSEKEPAFYNQN